ncbi:MAG: sigma-70 family RNA polymerase sigma factor [Nocardioides sp.]
MTSTSSRLRQTVRRPPSYVAAVVEIPRERRSRETADLFAAVALAETDPEREDLYEQVVMVNACVARGLAHRFARRGVAIEDLEQVAYLAMTTAARRYDLTRGHDFLQYAVPTISGQIKRYFRDHGWTIRVPRRIQEVQHLIDRADPDTRDQDGTFSVGRLAARLDLPAREIADALNARGCFQPTSLDLPIGEQGGVVLGDLIEAEEDALAAAEARAMIRPLVARLPETDQAVLRMRYDEDQTQQAIGEQLGVSQIQVSRMLTRIHRELRAALLGTATRTPVKQAS